MSNFVQISSYILATFLLLAGIAHFVKPKVFKPLFFKFIPSNLRMILIYVSGLAEIFLAIGILLPAYRAKAALLVFIMFVLYLPLHIRDIFIEKPVMGSKVAATIRLFIQFGLLYWVWLIWENS